MADKGPAPIYLNAMLKSGTYGDFISVTGAIDLEKLAQMARAQFGTSVVDMTVSAPKDPERREKGDRYVKLVAGNPKYLGKMFREDAQNGGGNGRGKNGAGTYDEDAVV